MFAAIEKTTAGVRTLEGTKPLFNHGGSICGTMTLSTVLRLLAITAHDVLLDLTAVAACGHTDIARSARTFVAGARAAVLPASQHVATDLTTAPAMFIVRIYTASSDGLATAEAMLSGAHQGARWARTSMTSHAAWMRTFLW